MAIGAIKRGRPLLRVVALIATYNEERFIAHCLDHLIQQGIEAYLIDNESTDDTVAISQRYLNRGVIGIETFPREGHYRWQGLLERKEQLAADLDADWFIHIDPDEVRLSPDQGTTLAEALEEVDRQGFNAVNFIEFTFVPTRQSPDHDHPEFYNTMKWYYPFLPSFPHRLNAWKKQSGPVELARSGGHRVSFPQLLMYPTSFPMRHYLFLSAAHAKQKYLQQTYDPKELARGWHVARMKLEEKNIFLQDESELRRYVSDELLNASHPLTQHPILSLSSAIANDQETST